MSVHWLPIERLRYSKPKIERKNRLCTLCNLATGNEYHALMECNSKNLTTARNKYVNVIAKMSAKFRNMDHKNRFFHIARACEEIILPPTIKWLSLLEKEYKDSY